MMKKNKILAAALLAAVLISGCTGVNSPSGTGRENEITTADMTETSSQETSVSTDTAVTEATKGGTDIETDWLEKLTEIVPPPNDPKCTGTAEMRAAAEKRLGAKLPDDYIELINTYGDGCFGYVFNVYNPFSDNKYYNLLTNEEQYFYEEYKRLTIEDGYYDSDGMAVNVLNHRDVNGKYPLYGGWYDNEGCPFGYYPADNGILACCQCEGQYTVYWKTGSDRWTIVAYGRYGEYSEFDMTLTEFLYKEITREINFGDMYDYLTEKGKVFIPFEDTSEECRIKEEDYKYKG